MNSTSRPQVILALVLACVSTLALSGPALANSALDQYVEQVPEPDGKKPVQSRSGDRPPSTGRSDRPDPAGVGQGSGELIKTADGKPETVRKGSYGSGASSDRGSAGSDASEDAQPGQPEADGQRPPGRTASWAKAAEVSGINAPLSIFVVLVALAMVGVAASRRFRSGSR